jgi:hypothetical protein
MNRSIYWGVVTRRYIPEDRTLYTLTSLITYLATYKTTNNKQAPCAESASELYRPSGRRLSAKLVPNLRIERCRVVSAADHLRP